MFKIFSSSNQKPLPDSIDSNIIKYKSIQKRYNCGNKNIIVNFYGAKYYPVSDHNEVLLDETIYSEIFKKTVEDIISLLSRLPYSKYCPLPKDVNITFGKNNNLNSIDDNRNTKNGKNEIIVPRTARYKLDDIYIPSSIREQLDKILLLIKHKKLVFSKWNLYGDKFRPIILNFYGPPGTGKSLTAEAFSGQLGKKYTKVNYAELESKYVGETPKNIKYVFQKAKEDDAIIIFDEADSFLGKRLTNITQSADYGVNITRSVMLLELENFDGIVIFTTNLLKNYDQAFRRRILSNIQFFLPDPRGRKSIFDIYINDDLPVNKKITNSFLADRYTNITGADIKDIVVQAAVSALYRNESEPLIDLSDFDYAYKVVKKRYDDLNISTVIKHEKITENEYRKEIKDDM